MEDINLDKVAAEDKLTALCQWWERHCKAFSLWYLTLSEDRRREILLKAVPDMPLTSSATNPHCRATDIILPEFSLEGMLASNGRLFLLFMARRLVPKDLCLREDIKLLQEYYDQKTLPSFTGGALERLDTAFVDPIDPEENVQALNSDTTAETRDVITAHLQSGRLVRAEIWVALKLRRTAIACLLEHSALEHYAAAEIKPSPTYLSLLQGELSLRVALGDSANGSVGTKS